MVGAGCVSGRVNGDGGGSVGVDGVAGGALGAGGASGSVPGPDNSAQGCISLTAG